MTLQRLRRAHLLIRFVLMWFVLSLGLAVASPVLNPEGAQLVCAGASVKLVKANGEEVGSGHTLDCPLCASGAVPELALDQRLTFDPPCSHAVRRDTAARVAVVSAAPLSARAPPSL